MFDFSSRFCKLKFKRIWILSFLSALRFCIFDVWELNCVASCSLAHVCVGFRTFDFSYRELDWNALRNYSLRLEQAKRDKKIASMGIFNDLPVPSDKTVSPHSFFTPPSRLRRSNRLVQRWCSCKV